jgi:RNA ligase (TIGR02306 family)
MSSFEVLVYKIKEPVIDHPDADRLSIIQIEGYLCISAKLEDGSHRYKQGDLVVYIPEGAVMPEWMLKEMDFWDVNKNKPAFRYVKAKKLRGIFSQGILYPILPDPLEEENIYWIEGILGENFVYHTGLNGTGEKNIVPKDTRMSMEVFEGDDVKDFLGIVKYEPVVPANMAGSYSGEYIKHTMRYDFDSIQKNKGMFEEGEQVFITEKVHGTLCEIGYIPELDDDLLFNRNIFVTSKGIGAKGFIYKNLDANKDNLYVKIIKGLIENGLTDKLVNGKEGRPFYPFIIDSIHIFGEIFGEGVQDLGYGQKEPQFRVFDIAINKNFLDVMGLKCFAQIFGLELVPILYEGPFSWAKIEELRDGNTTFDTKQIREGIVIKSDIPYVDKFGHSHRKIAKFVSPEYLLRKGNTTEFE